MAPVNRFVSQSRAMVPTQGGRDPIKGSLIDATCDKILQVDSFI